MKVLSVREEFAVVHNIEFAIADLIKKSPRSDLLVIAGHVGASFGKAIHSIGLDSGDVPSDAQQSALGFVTGLKSSLK